MVDAETTKEQRERALRTNGGRRPTESLAGEPKRRQAASHQPVAVEAKRKRGGRGLLISTMQPPADLNLRYPLPAGAAGDEPLELRADENNSWGTCPSYFRNAPRIETIQQVASDDVSEKKEFQVPEICV